MSTGRTTDDRDRDTRRHQDLVDRLDRIERRLDAIEHHTRTPAPSHRPPSGLPWGDTLWCDMEKRWTRTADRRCSCNDKTGCTFSHTPPPPIEQRP